MFNVHNPEVGGPFESQSDAMAAIELHRTPRRIPLWPKEYFTIKDGLFHIHPYDLGGPSARLDDAFAALQMHRFSLKPDPLEDYWKDAAKKACNMQKWLDGELDPTDLFRPVTSPQNPVLHKCPEEDIDFSIDDFEQEIYDPDPVVSEVLQYLHGLEREEEIGRDGMMWMENDATKAFKAYLSSTETKVAEYVFHKLDYQCLIYDGPNIYHHYNFIMNIKLCSKNHSEYKSYFAEVKYMADGKQYFCCPLKDTDDAPCFGCRNVGVKLRDPANGGYEEDHEGAGFPFDTVGEV